MAVFRPAIMSASLGRAWVHDFEKKVKQAATQWFEGIEIFYEDLEYFSRQVYGVVDEPSSFQILAAAEQMGKLLKEVNLIVIGLQPFLFYEGLLDRREQKRLVEKFKIWLQIAKLLGTNTIQIPANFLPADKLTGDMNVIVGDMVELADLAIAESPPVRLAYESLCWSTHIDTWERAWEVVCGVNRPNFGLCLDTFNIAGRVWADPASPTGKTPNADADLANSIDRLVQEIGLKKVFYIQVVDAERMESPLVKGHPYHVEGNPARMNWSRNARTYIYETERGAYLPVEGIARALIERLGYKGFVSMELFSRTMFEEGEDVPEAHARRGIVAWRKLVERLGLN